MTETQLAEESLESESPLPEPQTSTEDKFLGVKSTVGTNKDSENIEVEVVDDRPEEDRKPPRQDAKEGNKKEVEDLSEGATKRIQKLKYDYHEERREKEKALRLRDEAVTHAKRAVAENQRLSRLVGSGQQELIKQAQEKAEYAKKSATKAYKEAYESGDAEAIAKAQTALTEATFASQEAVNLPADIANKVIAEEQQIARNNQNKQPQQRQPEPIPEPVQPDAKAQAWAEKNEWFGKDEEMTSFAYGLHNKLVTKEGLDPTTDEYYDRINSRMKEVFPDSFEGTEQAVAESEEPRKSAEVVAPATRNNGARPKKVKLTATQVSLARKLGITPEQYAAQLVKDR
jgi:hypothetical protein